MIVGNIRNMHEGWFAGEFAQSVLRTKDFEACHKIHKKGEKWEVHYHEQAVEVNYLLRGSMTLGGRTFNAGDVFVIEPFEVADPEFLEDCELFIVKCPSVPGDKIVTSLTAEQRTKRTAILISGQAREIAETWPSFIEFLYRYWPNPDVFIYASEPYPPVEGLFKHFWPKEYVVEKQYRHLDAEAVLRDIPWHDQFYANNYLQQIWGWKRLLEIKRDYTTRTGVQYDYVIRTRPDVFYVRPITMGIVDLGGINNLHAPFAPTTAIEFAVGPNHLMEQYLALFDWIVSYGRDHLTSLSPRLDYPPDHKYNCDVVQTVYLKDALGLTLPEQRLKLETFCPYQYYRLMNRHKRGEYAPIIRE